VARPIAYSYARFSTPEQERGDSERRQIDAARHYAEQQGFDLDESVVVDRGISAFAGKNVSEEALGEFIKRVERKKITRGSALFVESHDRGAGRSFWMWRPIME
jgi:DNA invertase Pin-like site-specific DNA recombinase